jgi:bifunctional DNA-binding transcriptional regulator/antitoxin component of YhaV-PrlF toxin-antitoxin module
MTSKGQVTIAAQFREALDLKPGDDVLMTLEPGSTVRLQRIPSFGEMLRSLPLRKLAKRGSASDLDNLANEALADQALAYRTRGSRH